MGIQADGQAAAVTHSARSTFSMPFLEVVNMGTLSDACSQGNSLSHLDLLAILHLKEAFVEVDFSITAADGFVQFKALLGTLVLLARLCRRIGKSNL